MQSLLKEMSIEQISAALPLFEQDAQYARALNLVLKIRKKLSNHIGKEEQELLERLSDAQDELMQLTSVKSFACGYQQALVLTAESFLGVAEIFAIEDL